MRDLQPRGSAHPPAPVTPRPIDLSEPETRALIDDARSSSKSRRKRPEGRQTMILNVRMQRDEYADFTAAAGDGYGGRSELFRKIWRFWQQGDEVRALQVKYNAMRTRALAAERKLQEVEKAIHG